MFEEVAEGRRRNMQANRSRDTKPEMTVRRLLHAMGYRYRLHCHDLPGKPDIVFPRRRKVIEVRGCFWHGHGCARIGQVPKSRVDYWIPKIARNRERDARNAAALTESGWDILEMWECTVRAGGEPLREVLSSFLGSPGHTRVAPLPPR